MKMIKVKSFAAVVLASAAFYGCASSNDGMDDTTASDVSMSETQTMAGDTDTDDANVVVVTEEVVAATPIASFSLENTEEVGDMFKNIADTKSQTLMDLARQSPNLSTFVQLMDAAGLADDLKADGAYTLFAPTNEAFSKVSQEDLKNLLLPQNKNKLSEILMVHVLPNKVVSTSLNSTKRISLDNDRYIPVTTQLGGKQIAVGGANVVMADVEASNGVIHVVDNVIIPSKSAMDDGGIR